MSCVLDIAFLGDSRFFFGHNTYPPAPAVTNPIVCSGSHLFSVLGSGVVLVNVACSVCCVPAGWGGIVTVEFVL